LEAIYDFGGFPQQLFDKVYPARGDSILSLEIANKFDFGIDYHRGLDHGVWSVLAQIYPKADIPIVQISLDYTKTAQQHFELGQQLAYLRDSGVLILGSGNIVHNLGLIDWSSNKIDSKTSWADNFDKQIISNLRTKNFKNIVNYTQYPDYLKSVPTPEHFWPLLYVAGACKEIDSVEIFNDSIVMDSISMTSVKFG
jgi:4,5-DOPA dioxygenase extradiol